MKKSDLYRELARVIDMCEGTGVDPKFCWKYEGVNINGMPYFDSELEQYEFAVAILEDKPVFVGDKVYANNCTSPLIVGGISKQKGYIFVGNCINYDISILSLNPPKKTFLLNGVELPLPNSSSNGIRLDFLGVDYFFETVEDRNKVAKAINDLLEGESN